MTEPRFVTEAIADFALRGGNDDLDGCAASRLKRNPQPNRLRAGALDASPVSAIRGLVEAFGGAAALR